MIPAPQPPESRDNDVIEAEAAVWGFLIALFIFKLVTVAVIFWYTHTWDSGVLLGATLWYWFPPLIALAAGPVFFYYRLRKVRARRDALQRSEWMLDDEPSRPTLKEQKRS